MENYEHIRSTLVKKLVPPLPQPVGTLISVAYEPRLDSESYSEQFHEYVDNIKSNIKDEVRQLTAKEGARIELVAMEALNDIKSKATELGHYDTINFLEETLGRREPKINNDKRTEKESPKLIERVLSSSGKPIGLWR